MFASKLQSLLDCIFNRVEMIHNIYRGNSQQHSCALWFDSYFRSNIAHTGLQTHCFCCMCVCVCVHGCFSVCVSMAGMQIVLSPVDPLPVRAELSQHVSVRLAWLADPP